MGSYAQARAIRVRGARRIWGGGGHEGQVRGLRASVRAGINVHALHLQLQSADAARLDGERQLEILECFDA